ncbi:MAG: N-acetylmuramoyl-L-alanine amidase [Anaerolineae bacterium]|nr:N-acetylmuramoyl-L-alanine amidase [Anaerolineae bacterium]MDW8173349.1 N-acetylmuramoyl-L-alanine amidase [Anaerolineae bacterium]
MPNDSNFPPPSSSDPASAGQEVAASAIFAEILRQAAARRAILEEEAALSAPTPLSQAEAPAAPDLTPTEGPQSSAAMSALSPQERAERARRNRERQAARAIRAEAAAPNDAEFILPRRTSAASSSPSPAPTLSPSSTAAPSATPSVRAAQATGADALLESKAAEKRSPAQKAQQLRRLQRRQQRARQRRAGFLGGFLRTTIVLLTAAGLTSTIFTWFTQPDFLNRQVAASLVVAESTPRPVAQPTPLPTPNWLKRIGIVSGHRGPQNDPGAVCPDGLTEAEINFNVASSVVRRLRAMGFTSDLLDEFDARLDNYQAAAMVSIHANTCKDFGERVSGYIVAKAAARPEGGLDTLLAECVAKHYGRAVPLERRFSLTRDMTEYHSFREINPLTPAAIIELGFMKDDREILTTKTEQMAQGIVDGLLCFLQPQNPPSGQAVLVTPGLEASPTSTVVHGE